MKKILLIAGLALLVGIAGFTYWYWQSQQNGVGGGLQTVALDNPNISSFDDVCTAGENSELNCTGNIEELGCDQYFELSDTITFGLEPVYPMIGCKKKNDEVGVYTIKESYWPFGVLVVVDYIIIKDNLLQFIQSEEQFLNLSQPIESISEAKAYFDALNEGVLVVDEETLNRIKYPQALGGKERTGDHFLVPVESIGLSQVTETPDGYLITSYSDIPDFCDDEVYLQTFLLTKDGYIHKQNEELIWETLNKPSCID